MNKVVLKTALKTVIAVLIAFLAAFGIMSLAFPQTMATISEDLHWYSMATGYSSLRYTYTKDANDLARCAENSILSGKNADIIDFCSKLTENEKFGEICEKKDKSTADENGKIRYSYRQYIYGYLTTAQYAENDKEGAVSSAEKSLQGVEGFPKPNAVGDLAYRIAKRGDFTTAQSVLKILNTVTPAEGEQEYYNIVVNVLTFE